jgi:hypothetical protein
MADEKVELKLTNSGESDSVDSSIVERSLLILQAISRSVERGTFATFASANETDLQALAAYLGAAIVARHPERLDQFIEDIAICRELYSGLINSVKEQGVAVPENAIMIPVSLQEVNSTENKIIN